MIEAHELSRRYGPFTAVDRISFSVAEGEIVGILGPNGAGKTTTIRMITGFLPPTGGTVTVGGRDLFTEPRKARRDIGYLPENVALYTEMRVREYLAYRARLEGMRRTDARRALADTIDRALLGEVADQIIGTLSKGYRQRVGLAAAILHQPRVLVLDEPTVGLDPRQIIAIRELIRELGRERTLLLSTHILPEVELLCDRVLIIDGGRIVAQGTVADLHQRWLGQASVRVEIQPGSASAVEVAEVLSAVPGVTAVRPVADDGSPHLWQVEAAGGADPRAEIFRAAVEQGWVLLGLAEERGTLEDVFVHLTTREEIAPAGTGSEAPPPASGAPGELPS
ncbi:MAG TPA: ATP-binding cassette domain-containing protein [Thermoanaerobaculia bacterium]|nr:ATP-binding cassette domain-containing protein [Thermoanaerobaculia bacterium]